MSVKTTVCVYDEPVTTVTTMSLLEEKQDSEDEEEGAPPVLGVSTKDNIGVKDRFGPQQVDSEEY